MVIIPGFSSGKFIQPSPSPLTISQYSVTRPGDAKNIGGTHTMKNQTNERSRPP
jgi:hypothetical protein